MMLFIWQHRNCKVVYICCHLPSVCSSQQHILCQLLQKPLCGFSLRLKLLHFNNAQIITRRAPQIFFPSSALCLLRSCRQPINYVNISSIIAGAESKLCVPHSSGIWNCKPAVCFLLFILISLCVSTANSHRHYANDTCHPDPVFRE